MVRYLLPIAAFLLFHDSTAQPAHWSFDSRAINQFEYVLTLSVAMAPGWHVYSQFMEEGGPTPTRLKFEQNPDLKLIGAAAENGKPVKFQDELYEMEIVWYTGNVTFAQTIMLNHVIPFISGRVEYLVCNEYTCVPGRQDFNIALHPPAKTP